MTTIHAATAPGTLSAAAQESATYLSLKRAGVAVTDTTTGKLRSLDSIDASIEAKNIADPIERIRLKRAAERLLAGAF